MKKLLTNSSILILLINFISCENKDYNTQETTNDNLYQKQNVEKYVNPRLERYQKLYREGELYFVVGDTVIIFKNLGGVMDDYTFYPKTRILFKINSIYFSDEENNQFRKKFNKYDDLKYVFSYDPTVWIHKENFKVSDERGETISLKLFSLSRDYYDIEPRKSYQTMVEWRLANFDAKSKWENNAVDSFNTRIHYLDYINNFCVLNNGYKAKLLSKPDIDYPFTKIYQSYISSIDTIQRLGEPVIVKNIIDSVAIYDFRIRRNYDYICVGYNGLQALAQNLGAKIVEKDIPSTLYLEKEQEQ